ncbi:MAG: phage head closure protein [Deltaproteobacteria bacterium]|uniref:Phage head closure protein n=1 Tax=Candidatus Zymogenus saltonus TaxID=2844893 RepID=A0A9D8KGX7_9DELT|nr:phage head closure protein [Candidatus Zymogenus saltonus]
MIGPKTKLVLQRKTSTSDSKGGSVVTWEDKREISGVLSTVSGYKQMIYDQLGIVATHQFLCDLQKGLTVSVHDRFRKGSEYYQIRRVDNKRTCLRVLLESGKGVEQT